MGAGAAARGGGAAWAGLERRQAAPERKPPCRHFEILFCVCAAAHRVCTAADSAVRPLLPPMLLTPLCLLFLFAVRPPLPLRCAPSSSSKTYYIAQFLLGIVLALSLSCMRFLGTNYFAVSSLCPFPLSRSHSIVFRIPLCSYLLSPEFGKPLL